MILEDADFSNLIIAQATTDLNFEANLAQAIEDLHFEASILSRVRSFSGLPR